RRIAGELLGEAKDRNETVDPRARGDDLGYVVDANHVVPLMEAVDRDLDMVEAGDRRDGGERSLRCSLVLSRRSWTHPGRNVIRSSTRQEFIYILSTRRPCRCKNEE